METKKREVEVVWKITKDAYKYGRIFYRSIILDLLPNQKAWVRRILCEAVLIKFRWQWFRNAVRRMPVDYLVSWMY